MKIQLIHKFEDIISPENLLLAWQEFRKGKSKRKDVQEFSFRLMDNIFQLHNDLLTKNYKHGEYEAFRINDPKPRDIHKAAVRDRLVHRAIYRVLYPFLDKVFIADSFSCRNNKGTHRAINKFREFSNIVSKNDTKTCWILKCDIKKFFASIDHNTLVDILRKYIPDNDILWLLEGIINGFYSTKPDVGLPLGNLTSQLFVNVYMNEFDQFVKHKLKIKYYIRYADDFVLFSENYDWLKAQIIFIKGFLDNELKLTLHPDKIFLKTLYSGLDFLGWVNFSKYRVLRTATKRRVLKRARINLKNDSLSSYLGLLKGGNSYNLTKRLLSLLFFNNYDKKENYTLSEYNGL